MARRAAEIAEPPSVPLRRAFQVLFYFTTLLMAAVGFAFFYARIEQFLVSEHRFALPGPPEPESISECFRIENAGHASEQQIIDVFSRDFGRSIYLCPIAERRRKLLAIDWIKDASVSRLWPNRIVIRVTERVPIAFVQTPAADGAMMYALIDEEGVMLDPQRSSELPLPVLAGIPASDTETMRRERVKRFLRLQSEIGPDMQKISEIDVADLDNLRVVVQFENRALVLMLGNRKFRERFDTFLNSIDEIRQRMPGATVLDARLKGRITAIGSTR
jgi:cell division protein FtsQ